MTAQLLMLRTFQSCLKEIKVAFGSKSSSTHSPSVILGILQPMLRSDVLLTPIQYSS